MIRRATPADATAIAALWNPWIRDTAITFNAAEKSPDEVARMIAADRIDILVDLAGHTGWNRLAMFGHRAAPVQVNFLGYPGTSGLSCMDYILADAAVAPFAHQPSYSEAIVHLPGSYLMLDSTRALPAPMTRVANKRNVTINMIPAARPCADRLPIQRGAPPEVR